VLKGNLAPDGAVIKPSAATRTLLKHRGRAVVFETIEDLHARIDDENLDIDEHCVMVLKNCGAEGLSGHGRGRQHAAAAQGAAQGHHGHGPHLGWRA
jgi:dihydroxyacid dehydratase/phosphogluconate dehydratase